MLRCGITVPGVPSAIVRCPCALFAENRDSPRSRDSGISVSKARNIADPNFSCQYRPNIRAGLKVRDGMGMGQAAVSV
jgi:hypothetical protein